MREVCASFGAQLREFNGDTDHVHLLVRYPLKVALSRLAGSLKGVSACLLRQEFNNHIRKYLWGETFGPRPTSPDHAAARPWRSSRASRLSGAAFPSDAVTLRAAHLKMRFLPA
ncbi:hypothetical protein GCM10023191_068080 [Actinoallomurus oryzae]|uniref:Transposase IS200-like domain-containing protein n=1 Tax=Actinoallomurus oryzae TaxID=502180 RepID=A0ABP8QUF9_9ACTN